MLIFCAGTTTKEMLRNPSWGNSPTQKSSTNRMGKQSRSTIATLATKLTLIPRMQTPKSLAVAPTAGGSTASHSAVQSEWSAIHCFRTSSTSASGSKADASRCRSLTGALLGRSGNGSTTRKFKTAPSPTTQLSKFRLSTARKIRDRRTTTRFRLVFNRRGTLPIPIIRTTFCSTNSRWQLQ